MLENKLKSGRREPFEDLKEGRTDWEGNVKLFGGRGVEVGGVVTLLKGLILKRLHHHTGPFDMLTSEENIVLWGVAGGGGLLIFSFKHSKGWRNKEGQKHT